MTTPVEPEHPVSRGNLSAWAVQHPALVLFLMIVFSVAGLMSYLNLGRAEDPSFAIKTMVITAAWPGATAEEMQDQVADKLEKRLQELELFDYVKTYTRPRRHRHPGAAQGYGAAEGGRRRLVPGAQEAQRQPSHPAAGRAGPVLQRRVRRRLFRHLHAVGLRRLTRQAQGLRGDRPPAPAAHGGRRQSRYRRRARAAHLHRVQPSQAGHARHHAPDHFRQRGAPECRDAAGTVETSADRIDVRVTGAFKGEAAIAEVPIEAGGRTFRLGDIATVKRGYEDPPSSIVRHNGSDAVGVVVAMTKGANVLELGKRLKDAIADAKTQVPTGVEIDQITDQPRVVEESVERVPALVRRGARHRARRQLRLAWMAPRPRRRDVRAARAGGRASSS